MTTEQRAWGTEMSKHAANREEPIIGARTLTERDRHGDWHSDEIATIEVDVNSITGGIEVWVDQIDPRTGVSGRALVNIRLTKEDALALAERLYDQTQEV